MNVESLSNIILIFFWEGAAIFQTLAVVINNDRTTVGAYVSAEPRVTCSSTRTAFSAGRRAGRSAAAGEAGRGRCAGGIRTCRALALGGGAEKGETGFLLRRLRTKGGGGKQRSPPPPDQFALLDHIVALFRGREALLLHLVKRRCSLERASNLVLPTSAAAVGSPDAKASEVKGEDRMGATTASYPADAATSPSSTPTSNATTQTCFDDLQREKAKSRRLEKRVAALELERSTLESRALELGVASESRRKDVVTLRDECLQSHKLFSKLSNILDSILEEDARAAAAHSLGKASSGSESEQVATAETSVVNPQLTVEDSDLTQHLNNTLTHNGGENHASPDNDDEANSGGGETAENHTLIEGHAVPEQRNEQYKSRGGQPVRKKSAPIAVPVVSFICMHGTRGPFHDFHSRRKQHGKQTFLKQEGHLAHEPYSESFLSTQNSDFALGTSLNPLACNTLMTPNGFSGFMSTDKLPMRFADMTPAARVKVAQRDGAGSVNTSESAVSMNTTPPRGRRRTLGGVAKNVTPLGLERSAFRAAMASAERRSARAALEACEEKLSETTAELVEMKARAASMEARAQALSQLMSSRARLLAGARGRCAGA